MNRTNRILSICWLVISVPAFSAQPAFDCAKSVHEIEKLICQDDELAALDQKMGKVYKKAMQTLPADDNKMQQAIQRGWIKGRNDCWKEVDKKACAIQGYDQRITELQIVSGQQVVPEPVKYRCDNGKNDYITAVFFNQTQMPAVVLSRVGASMDDHDIAYITPSGSGAKYLGNKVEFWTKGNEAMGSWSGKPFVCRE